MRRAGYGVWIAYDEPGSYEEGPPNLSDMLTRDRRWCAGNLQHFWFLFARGIESGSRMQIWIGLMGYLCSPLWLTLSRHRLLQRLFPDALPATLRRPGGLGRGGDIQPHRAFAGPYPDAAFPAHGCSAFSPRCPGRGNSAEYSGSSSARCWKTCSPF